MLKFLKRETMKKTLLFAFLLLFFCASSEAANWIYLKNGFIIKNVGYYEKTNGEIRFHYGDGIVGIPEEDVLRIESVEEPVVEVEEEIEIEERPVPRPEPQEPEPDVAVEAKKMLLEKLSKIQERLKEIETKEDRAKELDKEYNDVRLRIEVLFQKGRKQALAAGRGVAEWFLFLNPQERQWAKLNLLKKRKIRKEREELEEELTYLRKEKKRLLKDKRELEEELRKIKQ